MKRAYRKYLIIDTDIGKYALHVIWTQNSTGFQNGNVMHVKIARFNYTRWQIPYPPDTGVPSHSLI